MFAAIAALLWSCSDEERPYRQGRVDDDLTPTMTTLRANTTISDSGFLRYRILAPTWLMFENAKEPRWTFPDGMHMERYDNLGKVNATIDCDSATYFTATQTWRLDGAVDIASTDGQRFLTQQLWWNRLDRQVYSDSFIHIERPDRVIEGFGFKSNDQMTDYLVLNPSGIFPASQFNPGGGDAPATAAAAAMPGAPGAPLPPPDDPLYDPVAAAADDPLDARRTDTAFNGIPTDTIYVSSSASQRPRRRAARTILRRRTPYSAQHSDTAAAAMPATSPVQTNRSPLERSRDASTSKRVPLRRNRELLSSDSSSRPLRNNPPAK